MATAVPNFQFIKFDAHILNKQFNKSVLTNIYTVVIKLSKPTFPQTNIKEYYLNFLNHVVCTCYASSVTSHQVQKNSPLKPTLNFFFPFKMANGA